MVILIALTHIIDNYSTILLKLLQRFALLDSMDPNEFHESTKTDKAYYTVCLFRS